MKVNLDNINLDNYIVIGVSAGPDSMCLLNIMQKYAKKIVVCHINHNVRIQSTKEEEFLKKYCKNNNIIFESMTIKKYNENNFENEARKKRYEFYENILAKYNTKYLFLAHHGDDLIETILMKIIRGSNIEGYAGIKERNNHKDYTIIRPLLEYTKEEIINYNKIHNIPYFIDNSNTDIKYTRNRYRKKILPILKQEDPLIHKKFLSYSKTLIEYDNYIKNIVNNNITNIFINNTIYINELKKHDYFIIKNILYKILNTIYENQNNIITEKIINNILHIIDSKKPNLTLDLPQNKILIKEYDKMYINKKNKLITNYDYKIELKSNLNIDNLTFNIVTEDKNDGNNICRINSKDIKQPLYFRNKKNGDYIILKGSNHSKKIKEIFIENKIPKNIRNKYPILVDSNDKIIWIPNIKKSNICIKKDEKDKIYDIIIKCNEREENYE